ncbi:hypothetical protein [Catenisphaera adipataccumulans]|uniref:Lipoprotein n=1 Tax=Catenisphaera adipataccumulans TaxID=700500 RepID=A0A7W8FVR7_9FIRM|nr:hypothetical protein [Catenisphaera adipataccumulans]MBB5183443.1 hypothetical protein [Catenisphaera adipataccumulans]
MKIKLRSLAVWTICLFMALGTAGCSKKTALSPSEFRKAMEKEDYSITDKTEETTTQAHAISVLVAANSNKDYQIEYYQFESSDACIDVYDRMVSKIEDQYPSGKNKKKNSVSAQNSAHFSLTVNNLYMYVSRIDDTLIYCGTYKKNKNKAMKTIENLGY